MKNRETWYLSPLALVLAVWGADDPWAKVRELKSGTELRILRKGAEAPVLAKMDEASAESIVVVVKNEQIAIPKEEIDRIDYRPAQPGGRITKETRVTQDGPAVETIPRRTQQAAPPGPSSSVSSGLTIGSRPDFETIYRRPPPAPPAPKK